MFRRDGIGAWPNASSTSNFYTSDYTYVPGSLTLVHTLMTFGLYIGHAVHGVAHIAAL
jgi:hypothetical protein